MLPVIPVPVGLLVSVPAGVAVISPGGLGVVSVILVSRPVAPWPRLVPRLPATVRIPLSVSVSVSVSVTLIRRLAVSDAGVPILVAGSSPLVKIVLEIFLVSEKMVENVFIALKYLDNMTAHVSPVGSGHVALVHYRGPVVVEGPVRGLGWRPGVAAVVAGAGVVVPGVVDVLVLVDVGSAGVLRPPAGVLRPPVRVVPVDYVLRPPAGGAAIVVGVILNCYLSHT